MPEPTLTAEEWEALNKVWDNWPHRSLQPLASETVTFITRALSAVPRLALAAPVVGEGVERAWDDLPPQTRAKLSIAWLGKRLFRLPGGSLKQLDRAFAGFVSAATAPKFNAVVANTAHQNLMQRLAALTGEEGRDG